MKKRGARLAVVEVIIRRRPTGASHAVNKRPQLREAPTLGFAFVLVLVLVLVFVKSKSGAEHGWLLSGLEFARMRARERKTNAKRLPGVNKHDTMKGRALKSPEQAGGSATTTTFATTITYGSSVMRLSRALNAIATSAPGFLECA